MTLPSIELGLNEEATLSRCLVCFGKLVPLFWVSRPLWLHVVDVPYLGTFLFCLPLSVILAAVWNLSSDLEGCRETEVAKSGDSLMRLMLEAVQQ